ncbi:MAG TPA: sugar ABC transporter permease, partial [Clostridiaceae bacterium]|nr:sugar ABC transporter permease [Clostridiaceae bacterium]
MANIPGRLADTKLANSKKSKVFKTFVRQKYIQAFVIMGMLYILIFFYIPMIGNIIAFKNYSITTGLIGMFSSEWAGFKYFKEFFTDPNFWMIIRNTVGISVLKLIFSFPLPIIFAILINEIGCGWFKRFVQ